MEKEIFHIGTPRHSGRYPWGSGDNAEQRNISLLGEANKLKKQGLSEVEIAKGFGMNTRELRIQKSILRSQQRAADAAMAQRLKDKGYSDSEIGRRMNRNESSIRGLLNPVLKERAEITRVTANMLKEAADAKTYIDIGAGVESHLGISRTKLNTAANMLTEEGYKIWTVKAPQIMTGKETKIKILVSSKGSYSEVQRNKELIKLITDYSEDGGRSFVGLEPIKNISSDRIKIRYGDEGGKNKDGVIELRRGVPELSLGQKRYAQVRIGVDGSHFLKGMAIYTDDIPEGVDIIYNTNKKIGTPKEKVFKSVTEDAGNPFKSIVRQKHYIDENGETQLSAINIVGFPGVEGSGEEGSWGKWSKTLSSQMLSKQKPALAKQQLAEVYSEKKKEFDEIMALTNPVVKKVLLEGFAGDCDAKAVDLKAAALPRQKSHILLPIEGLKETEIYAPNYENGEKVVLIRHPHGGIFEIPELTVNNRNPSAIKTLGPRTEADGTVLKAVEDAVGINPKVAERLSGADFDGDTVLVIPNPKKIGIITSAPLKGLQDFDPKEQYRAYEGMPVVGPESGFIKQKQMGSISNLITDMTIKGADPNGSEIARAVRHSMVIIDAEKHNLNYKQSYIDNGIAQLKKEYQGGANRGASTLISRAKSEQRVYDRKDRVLIDPLTGKKVYEYQDTSFVTKDGKIVRKSIKSSKMAEVEDAFELSSGTTMEAVYATHANKLKALANTARKESLSTGHVVYSPSAKETYADEVAALKSKLMLSNRNKPLERQALLIANAAIKLKKEANPDMNKSDLKKIKIQEQAKARTRMSAHKEKIIITPKEWEAIQAGAVSSTVLRSILDNTDLDLIKQYATPRATAVISTAKQNKAIRLLAAGKTQAEVAEALGIPVSAVLQISNDKK